MDPAGETRSWAGGPWNLQSPRVDLLASFLKLVRQEAPLDQPPSARMFVFSAAPRAFDKEASKPLTR